MKLDIVFFCLAFLFTSWLSFANSLLSPKGVNYEGTLNDSCNIFCEFVTLNKMKYLMVCEFAVQALMNIKNGLEDPHSVLNWDADAVDPCSWTMITCSLDKFVIGL